MRYKCMVLDHDDTVVRSTETVNFPAFLDTLRQLRPDVAESLTLDDYLSPEKTWRMPWV